jgi:hypothetical protein
MVGFSGILGAGCGCVLRTRDKLGVIAGLGLVAVAAEPMICRQFRDCDPSGPAQTS